MVHQLRVCLYCLGVGLLIIALLGGGSARAADRGMSTQAQGRTQGKRMALVIGNGAYPNNPLPNTVTDARLLARTLRQLGFQVIKGENLTMPQMRRIIDQFGLRLGDAEVGLFYYAGHGIQVDGCNYLVPVDALLRDKPDVEYEAIKAGRVLAKMQSARARLNLVFLDASRDNPFIHSFSGKVEQGLASMDAPDDTIVAYATAPGSVTADGVGSNSPFAVALSRHLGQPGSSVERALKSAGAEVHRKTNGKQQPWILTNYYGEYFLAGGGVPTRKQKSPGLAREITNSVGMEFVLIPAGKFMMGSHESPEVVARNGGGKARDYRCEKPRHRVTIREPFYMQTTEVTQGQWQAIMGKNPSQFKQCGADCPVDRVSWEDAQKFIRRLNQKEEANQYRLPTEAEWEYACRAGTTTPFHFGKTISTDQANYDGNYVYGQGRKGMYREKTVPVKSFPPNPWGLYGMHGNVWEWVSDWYGARYYASSPSKDPQGPSSGQYRVLRGGSWGGKPKALRSASRRGTFPAGRGNCGGFRLVREAQ